MSRWPNEPQNIGTQAGKSHVEPCPAQIDSQSGSCRFLERGQEGVHVHVFQFVNETIYVGWRPGSRRLPQAAVMQYLLDHVSSGFRRRHFLGIQIHGCEGRIAVSMGREYVFLDESDFAISADRSSQPVTANSSVATQHLPERVLSALCQNCSHVPSFMKNASFRGLQLRNEA